MRDSSNTVTTAEAARFLRVSPSTLKRWADDGLIPSRRTRGGHRRFHRSDLQQLTGAPEPLRHDHGSWANSLSSSDEPLQLQGRLFEMRVRAGSWWAVAEPLAHVLVELRRRRDGGLVTVLQYQDALQRLQRTLTSTLAHVPRTVGAPTALLTSVTPSDAVIALVLLELCLAGDGWRTRFVGPATAKQIEDDVALRPPDAVIVGVDAADEQLGRLTRDGASPVAMAFFGLGEMRSEPISGITRLRRFDEARTWAEEIAAGAKREG